MQMTWSDLMRSVCWYCSWRARWMAWRRFSACNLASSRSTARRRSLVNVKIEFHSVCVIHTSSFASRFALASSFCRRAPCHVSNRAIDTGVAPQGCARMLSSGPGRARGDARAPAVAQLPAVPAGSAEAVTSRPEWGNNITSLLSVRWMRSQSDLLSTVVCEA